MTTTVRKGDRRKLDEMMSPDTCSHSRVYQGPNGYWYCADCPAWADDKDAYDGRTVGKPNYRRSG